MPYIRRNYPRVSLAEPVTVIIKINDRTLHNAVANNLSMGGMCITIEDNIEKQQNGTLEITHECDEEMLCFKAEFAIQWIKPANSDKKTRQFGIKFTYFDSADQSKLARIIIDQIRKNSVGDDQN